MDQIIKVKILKKTGLLKSIPENTLKNIIKKSKEIFLKNNEILFEEGSPSKSMYIILSGQVVVFKKDKQIAILDTYQHFGEMGLIDHCPRSVGIKAKKDTLLLEIYEEQFELHFISNAKILLSLLRTLSKQSRENLESLNLILKIEKRISQRLNRILDDSTNEIYFFDSSSFKLTQVNQTALNNLGYTKEQIQSIKITDLLEKTNFSDFDSLIEHLRSGKKPMVVFEDFHKRKNNSLYPVEVRIQLINEIPPVFVAIVHDNTETLKMKKKIESMAFFDNVTGLPNRNLLMDRLERTLAHGTRHNEKAAVLFMDVDNFKMINDSYGHHLGDLLLKEITERLKKCVRTEDTIARMGGDEFVLFLPVINKIVNPAIVAKRVLNIMKPFFMVDNNEIYVSFSIGISLFPNDGKDYQTLLKNSDIAMYHAKTHGKNKYRFCTSSMHSESLKRIKLETCLRRALEREEFLLYYQPKIDLKTGLIVGLEALIRWDRPKVGIVSPIDFIPIAEENRLILPIGEWALKTACKQVKTWENQGLPLINMAVNLSGYQLGQKKFIAIVKKIITQTNISPALLELEITESVLMENLKIAFNSLNKLHDMGIKLTIDDFGTGYSSLSYLKKLPISSLKIDRSFVSELHVEANREIVRAIVSISKSLNLEIVAEGIETIEQQEYLRSLGCNIMQGYLYSTPLPEKEIRKLIGGQKNYIK